MRVWNLIFHKGLKMLVIQLLNLIKKINISFLTFKIFSELICKNLKIARITIFYIFYLSYRRNTRKVSRVKTVYIGDKDAANDLCKFG